VSTAEIAGKRKKTEADHREMARALRNGLFGVRKTTWRASAFKNDAHKLWSHSHNQCSFHIISQFCSRSGSIAATLLLGHSYSHYEFVTALTSEVLVALI